MPDRVEFAALADDLIRQVDGGLDDPEWVKKRYMKKMRDADRTVYEVPFLTLQKGPVRLCLDPTGYDVPGAEAAVDLYLMPTYDPLATFYSEGGRWFIHSDFLPGPKDEGSAEEGRRAPLAHDTLNQVMEAIAEHAVPSL
ncbi:MAG: hypothetical protein BGO49_06355 [Planctomycetales bacterium 71-10]|nr:MAG: hypothetical protein BGO49_06355 [Planctomycetales bacterium 71-10]